MKINRILIFSVMFSGLLISQGEARDRTFYIVNYLDEKEDGEERT